MATTQRGIYHNTDYTAEADILEDERLMAESIEAAFDSLDTDVQTALINFFGIGIYDSTETYAVGDMVIHNSKIYRCTATTTGDFDDTKWEEVSVKELIDELDEGKADADDLEGKEDKSNKVTSISSSSTDTQYPSAKAVYDKFVGVETEIANIQSSRGHVYGIKRALSNNSSNAWERTDDAVGLVANATKNGGTVQNDFDNRAPWSEIKTLNYDITNKKILAYIGDPDFKFDGTNGDVYTQVPEFWYKIWQDETYEYIQIADYAKAGFTKSDKFMGARYTMGLVDNTLRSYSGLTPARSKTIGQFRTLARAIGNEFCLLDYRFFIIRLLYLVEYASYHSQSKLGAGMCSMRFSNDDVALLAESNTNRIIINTTGGNAFYVGQTISIGTSGRENFGVAEGRKITAINAYSDGTITGKEIIFDGEPVNIATTNVIWSSGQHSGGCDSLGMKSGCLASDNKHAVIYRGFENIFGNVWQWMDGYNIKDNQGWVCYNPADYASDKFEAPYKQMGYANVNANGWSKKLGLDVNNPLIRTPIEVGGGDSTYQCDYHYQNTGNRVARVGGALSYGTDVGLWYLYFVSASSGVYWNIGCRVLINQ